MTEIGSDAFMKCKSLKSVLLPESLVSIGSKCFSDCVLLESVVLPSGVKILEEGVFNNCAALASINLNFVETIGRYAFSGCASLTDMVLPETLNCVQESAFAYCSALNFLDIKNAEIVFEGNAFTAGMSIEVEFPAIKDIQGINGDAISKITSVTSNGRITMNNGEDGLVIESADYRGELDLTVNLSDINENGIVEIGDKAFKLNLNLTNIVIPESVKRIGDSAFSNCLSLKEFTIPENVTEIGETAFYSCRSLSDIIIPDSVIKMGSSVFDNLFVIYCEAEKEPIEWKSDWKDGS